ncbi:transporter substrate-binding domain-containing protein [Photobacterium makurazakiensis]|uniref:transporter substrate-binding domain-containing protein n=1 Tax=Photobacterium makurazakiensis TaxID=2910234 RepID=UPI003D0A120A
MIRTLLLLLLLLPAAVLASEDKPTLRIGYPAFDWAPFTFVSQKGRVSGLLPSLVHELTHTSGYNTKTTLYPTFADVLHAFNNNEIDILVGVSSTYERQKYMHFSKPLVVIPMAAISQTDNIQSINQLKDKLIAVEQGFAIREQLQQLSANPLQLVSFPTSEQAFMAVQQGTTKAYIGNAITLDVMQNHYSTVDQLPLSQLEDVPYERLYLAAHKSNREIIDKLNSGLDKISQHRLNNIYDTWLTTSQQQYLSHKNYLNLNEDEARWLDQRSTLKIAYHPNDFPYQFTDKSGLMAGMGADVLSLLARQLNTSLVPLPETSFTKITDMLNEGTIDAVAAVTCTPERLQTLNCTQPYSEERWVMVTSVTNKREYIDRQTTIGVVKNRFGEVLSKQLYDDNPVILYQDNKPLLQAVLAGEINTAVISLSSASTLLQSNYLGRLRVLASKLDSQGRPIGIAMAKNNPILRDIMNKAMAALPPSKFTDVKNKWNTVTLKSGVSANKIVLWTLVILAVVAVALCSFAYWNRKLSNEIRQRKNAENKLTYLTNNFDGVLLQHLQRSDDPSDIELLFISEKIQDLIGIPSSAFYAQPQRLIELLQQRNDNVYLFNAISEAVSRGYWQTELQLQSAGGAKRWVEIRSQVFPVEQGWQWNSILIDISQAKQQQIDLEWARQQAESATEAKSRFLAMMSHEIRTPISGILSLLELMEPFSNRHKETKGLHKSLDQSAHNLLNIVNDVLDFSKIEAGKLKLSPAPCYVSELLNMLVQPHIMHAKQKGLGFSLWVDPALANQLLIDELRLKQVLNNLLNNATKFTEQGQVSLYIDIIDQTIHAQTLKVSVKDTGIGISPDDTSKLFQPFEQADVSTERRFCGTGLGLSICRQIVNLMGGNIEVDSQLGEGTTFSFTFKSEVCESVPTSPLNLRCGLIGTSLHDHVTLPHYLNFWQCETVPIKPSDHDQLMAMVDKYQLNTLLIAQSWAVDNLSTEWVNKLPRSVAILTFSDVAMLSPEPDDHGWLISHTPLLPEHLRHALLNPVTTFDALNNDGSGFDAPPITREQAILENKLLLVAEDHPINQQIIAQQLSHIGYYADIADNGKQALEALSKYTYPLLLTDCHMPELDGYGLVKAIRQQNMALPVVALTANTASHHIEEAGFNAFLAKPVSLTVLAETLAQWITPLHQTTAEQLTHDDEWDLGSFKQQNKPKEPCLTKDNNRSLKSTTGNQESPISLTQLESIFGERSLCINFMHQYLEACITDCADLKHAITQRNHQSAKLICHRMKGAARMMEFEQMADQCQQLEQHAATETITEAALAPVRHLIHKLEQQVEQLK